MTCEKCWGDAYLRSMANGRDQVENYRDIVTERDLEGRACSPRERAGQWWDTERGVDSRLDVGAK